MLVNVREIIEYIKVDRPPFSKKIFIEQMEGSLDVEINTRAIVRVRKQTRKDMILYFCNLSDGSYYYDNKTLIDQYGREYLNEEVYRIFLSDNYDVFVDKEDYETVKKYI